MKVSTSHRWRLQQRQKGVVRRSNDRSTWDADYLLDDYLHHRELRYEGARERPIGPIPSHAAQENISAEELRLLGGQRPRASLLIHRPGQYVLYESAIVAQRRHLDLLDRNARLLPQSPDLPWPIEKPTRKRLVCVFCSPALRREAEVREIEIVPYRPRWTSGHWPTSEASAAVAPASNG